MATGERGVFFAGRVAFPFNKEFTKFLKTAD
jgi:hypothetical protein